MEWEAEGYESPVTAARLLHREGGMQSTEPPFHVRRDHRLPGHDYRSDGAYFITVCTIDRSAILGDTKDGSIVLNTAGRAVAAAWEWLPTQYAYVSLDEWCVMPDHLHGIIVVGNRLEGTMGGSRTAPTDTPMSTVVATSNTHRKSLGGLVGAFKTVSTKHINALRGTPGAVVWQRDFWDHIVRDLDDLHRIRRYIRQNPLL